MMVLVTGGAGYISLRLVRRLLSTGHEVRVLDRLDYGGSSLLEDCASERLRAQSPVDERMKGSGHQEVEFACRCHLAGGVS
jgi:nucleoside-diphosphate-sugar epimerase